MAVILADWVLTTEPRQEAEHQFFKSVIGCAFQSPAPARCNSA